MNIEVWDKEDKMGEHEAAVVGASESDDSLATYVRQITRYPLLNPEAELELARRAYDHQDDAAATKLINSNLRFVVRVALQYRFSGAKVLDLIQEGNLGLIMAVRKFNPHKGCRLITYAVWWIRAYIQNYVMKTWSVVRIGTTQTQRKLFYKMGAIGKMVQSDHGSEDCYESLASDLDVTRDDLVEMRERVTHRDVSLDCPFDEDDELAPLDLLRSTFPNQEEVVSREEERALRGAEVEKALKSLAPREAYVVKNRIMAVEPHTLQNIGDRLNISRERVRQIELRALKKLKIALQEQRLADDGRVVTLARTQTSSPHPPSQRGWSSHLRTA